MAFPPTYEGKEGTVQCPLPTSFPPLFLLKTWHFHALPTRGSHLNEDLASHPPTGTAWDSCHRLHLCPIHSRLIKSSSFPRLPKDPSVLERRCDHSIWGQAAKRVDVFIASRCPAPEPGQAGPGRGQAGPIEASLSPRLHGFPGGPGAV